MSRTGTLARRFGIGLGSLMLLVAPAAAQDDAVTFRRRAPAPVGEPWTVVRTSRTAVNVRVFVSEALKLDNSTSLDVTERFRTEALAPLPGTDHLWHIQSEGNIGGQEMEPFEAYVAADGDRLGYVLHELVERTRAGVAAEPRPGEPPTAPRPLGENVDPAPLAPGDPSWTLWMASLGVTTDALAWQILPERPLRIGEVLPVPVAVAESLVRAHRLEVRSMTWTLSRRLELQEAACAEFLVRAELRGAMDTSLWNAIPSTTTTVLTGRAVLELNGGRLRRLELAGDLTLQGSAERSDLSLRLDGSGQCVLEVAWDPVPRPPR